jgi:Secretion system C-terminal sorting domain/FG-GAP-like repeat
MKVLFLYLLLCSTLYSQDVNSDGSIEKNMLNRLDVNGDGLINRYDAGLIGSENTIQNDFTSQVMLNFATLWESPPGAFTNCWDGITGYFDSDTLLDIAGFTFTPAKFYIYEQSPTNPGNFTLVQEFIKAEGGSYGPITAADTDSDGKIELITADVLGIARIYIYENDGNNNYVAQTSFSHPSNSQGGQGIYAGDMNKNGRKEIILLRGTTGGGEVRIWEHTGVIGTNSYTNIYTYSTPSYIFGKGGYGDSDNDGWDEVLLTYGGLPVYNTFIRRIEFDSLSSTFQHQMFEAPSIGFPAHYKVYDLGNDNTKELIMTCNSNSVAAAYVFRSGGINSYNKIDSLFESSDNNNMLTCDLRVLSGNPQPVLLMGSFNGRVYTYQYNGTRFIKDYENLNYPGAAIRRVYWLPVTTYDGYFNTWSGTNSNGTFYVFKRDIPTGIGNQQLPLGYRLYQNYPNPFNPSTKIKYELNTNSYVRLSIFDLKGLLVEILTNKRQSAGKYEVDFNAEGITSGVYFYRLETEESSLTGKMVLIK